MTKLPEVDLPIYLEPTDTEVAAAIALLGLEEHERPEGYAACNGDALVRMPRRNNRPIMGDVHDVAEWRAWCTLMLRECIEAEACVEEQARRATDLDEREEAA